MHYTYDSETGLITKHYQNKNGIWYRRVAAYSYRGSYQWEGRMIPLSHLCWYLYYGVWPDKNLVIDHINNCPCDNRIINLQEITRSHNALKARNADSPCGCNLCITGRNRYLLRKMPI